MENRERAVTPLEALRSRLGKMTERIIFRLQDRTGLPLNPPVYEPSAVPISGRSSISFLEFAVQGLETYHASLGRYEYPDQHPIISAVLPPSLATRSLVEVQPLPHVEINLRDKLLPFYCDTVLPKLCEPSDNPDTYGETAFLDADVLELLNERINIGRYVARTKVEDDPSIWQIVSNTNELIGKLKDPKQEERVMASVHASAERHGLRADIAELVFRWVIERTIDVEIAYLQGIPQSDTK